ncbi:uncharacterized protein PAF06_000603 [Gastrophryne carolinensis]
MYQVTVTTVTPLSVTKTRASFSSDNRDQLLLQKYQFSLSCLLDWSITTIIPNTDMFTKGNGVTPVTKCSTAQQDLHITNVTSPQSAQLLISWNSSSSLVATFTLDLRVVNNNSTAPITGFASSTTRSKLMQGLRAGTYYNVTLKSFASNGKLLETTWVQSQTLSAAPQITIYNGISSSEISVGWTSEYGVDYYFLMVTLGTNSINRTVSGLNCSITGLQPSSLYNLNVYGVNSAGSSVASKRVTALTLTQPPGNVNITTLSSYAVTITWTGVEKALMYGIFVYEDGPNPRLTYIRKTTSVSITLDNLLPCTKYIFGLTSYNWFYNAGEENQKAYETGQLDSPNDLTIQYNSNLATAVLSWSPSLWASSYMANAKSESGHETLCISNSTSCDIRGLQCEQTYKVRVTAQMDTCMSNDSEPLFLETAPCAPENVTVTRDCEINTVSMYWNPVLNAVKYNAYAAASDGSKIECSNRDTFCFFMNMLCGTEYELGVSAFNGKINGSSSPGIKIRTAPCDPQNVKVNAECQGMSLQVSWDPSEGATWYFASALGSSGATYNCSSVNTSCQIAGQCGESMSVSVIAYDDNCPSMSSEVVEAVTAPCAPKNISALTSCETNSTQIQWDFSNGAIMYVAQAVGNDGSKFSCESFEQSCSFSGLPCSHTYSVSVTATNYQCVSRESPSVQFKTVPCIPKDINAELTCSQNTILVSWAQDNENVTFTATAKSNSSAYDCTSQDNLCEITNVTCGQSLTISVEAKNGHCLSSSNKMTPLFSAPCKAEDVSTKSFCANKSLEISWTKSLGLGTDMYVAVLENSDAQELVCHSVEDRCIIQDIQCGETYRATVSAVNSKCETRSSILNVDPVPCSPVNVQSEVGADVVVLSWMGVTGALNYTTDITGNNGEKSVCETSNTSCSLAELLCGHQYQTVVTAVGQHCKSNASDIHVFQTAPCAPQNVTAEVDCVTNVATISWERSLGAGNYTAVVVGVDREQHVCHSSETSCAISGLSCGQSYTASILATNGDSTSKPSSPVDFHTAPCTPILDPPHIICYNNSASLSWSRTPGAISYTANMSSPEAEALSCHTEDTGCTINGLKCGHIYTITVTSSNSRCSVLTNVPATLTTGPCQPQNVVTQMACSNSSARISWESALGAMSYLTMLKSPTNDYTVCNSSQVGCEILTLPCGQTYDVIVTAVNDLCASEPSFPVQLYTVPCVPREALSDIDCESNVVTLAWAATLGAVNYTSVATGPQGQQYYCHTTNTSCSFPQLACGLKLDVALTAVGNSCNSVVNQITTFHTVPCKSANLNVQYQCGAEYAALSWMEAAGGITYKASAIADDRLESECNTSAPNCTLHNIHCGKTYKVTVESFGSSCNSTTIFPEYFYTAPCTPQSITSDIDCHVDDKVVLSWDRTPGASNYTVLAIGADGQHTCHTTATTCEISSLHCGLSYNVVVTPLNAQCQGESNSTSFATAPCAPYLAKAETDCDAESVTLSWSEMPLVQGFTSYLLGSDGVNQTCNSTEVNCTFPALQCGHEYNAVVYAVNKQCQGPLSNSRKVNSAPCVPMDVKTSVDCTDNSVLIAWDYASGAINYTSSLNSLHGDRRNCSTEGTSCRIQELSCGDLYTTVVTAHNSMCSSGESSTTEFKSVPCPPANLQANLSIGVVDLTWSKASGAVNYTTEVQGDNRETFICQSSNTSCVMTDLKCGNYYTMIVKANGEECSSKVSYNYAFKTGPCTPQNVRTQLDCVTNSVTVSWNTSLGAENYTSMALGRNGEYHVCNSTTTSCGFSNLTCGMSYEVTVTAINEVSRSESSLPVYFITAPCIPLLDLPHINCNDNSVSLSWNRPSGATSFIANVTNPETESLSCSTEDTGCLIRGLKCGKTYDITVTAANAQCSTPTTAPATLKTGKAQTALKWHICENEVYLWWLFIITVPCQPQDVVVKMDCHNSSTRLSWNEAPGALRYVSTLTDSGQEKLVCNSTGPACEISGLQCGQSYNVTVKAFNDECQSTPSSLMELYTVPCMPTEPEAKIDCESSLVTLSWISSLGAVNYSVLVTSSNGDEHFCSTTNTSCSFSQLSCGLEYKANIVATGKMCVNGKSLNTTFHTAPCGAQDIHSQFQCGSHHAILSWQAAAGGVNYTATITNQDGASIKCSTSDTQCTAESLQCGQIYTISVESFGVVCSSKNVSTEIIQTEPCVPQDIIAEIGCELNNATVSWSSTLGSENFTAQATSQNGQKHTCQTTSTSCEMLGLHCGLTYNVSVTAFNSQCQGASSPSVQLITAPCALEQVRAVVDCATNSYDVSWNPVIGVENVTSYLTDVNDRNKIICHSVQANCSFLNLPCGNEYTVTVSAANSQCSGPLSEAVKILTAPCVAGGVNKALDCVSNSALISWSQSQGALNYTSVLTGPQDNKYSCNSQGTSCWVRDIPCGEDYTVAVVAQNGVCSSGENSITILQACSCAQQNVSIFYHCNSDAVTLDWLELAGAVQYKSMVVSSHGESYTCETTNSTCNISGIQCGKNYNVTITAFNEQHANTSIGGKTFQTAPCISTNVRAQQHCGTNMASLSWEPGQGADTYQALVIGQSGQSITYASNSSSCEISDLECGQVYNVTLTAINNQCNTVTRTTEISTAPCIPQNVRTFVSCETNITNVSWDRTPGAVNYTATVKDVHGKEYSCATKETTCSIEALGCGQTYQLTVTAYGEQCTTESTAIEFHTGPCVPQTLEASPLCAWDFLTLSWGAALGADYYTGTLMNENGKTLTCNTTDQRCDIRDLLCGNTYNATVTAYNDQCSRSSLPILLSTAPCVPTNPLSSVSCDTQSVTVSWDDAIGMNRATTYIVTARNVYNESSFSTTSTSYTFTDLMCDKDYEITISGKSNNCNSHGNSSLRVKTIPCPPQILSAYAACDNNSGIIQWDGSQNAHSFMALVNGVNSLSCNTSDTSCEIAALTCGQNYTVTVQAEDGKCTGKPSTEVIFKTAPCIPQNVNSTLRCKENAFNVSWEASRGAMAYSVIAVGRHGQFVNEETQDYTYLMSDLQCGEVYNITVLALHDECKSSESAVLEVTSVPCSPMSLQATADCNVNGATAVWEPSAGAMSYMAVFSGPEGDKFECNSSTTSCSVSGLQCGQDYNVTVTAFDNTCFGVTSDTTVVTTTPCTPTNTAARIDCSSADLINVTWTPSRGAESYIVTAKTGDGHILSCNTTTSACNIRGAQCGQQYQVSIIARNKNCLTDTIFIANISTVPCAPDIVEVSVDCLTQEALVSWKENNTFSTYHTASARDPLGNEQHCNGISSSCSISGLECGIEYSFYVYTSTRSCSSLPSAAYLYKTDTKGIHVIVFLTFTIQCDIFNYYHPNTAPCEPKNVTTELQCESNDSILSWTKSSGALYYIATLVGNGSTLHCNTTDTQCVYRGLQCGQTYNTSVMAMDDKCASLLSATNTFSTAPCQPQGFSIDLDCSTQIVSMLWKESDGAWLYSVQMESSDGTLKSYTTTSVSLSSEILSCGETYGFTVVAIGETCNSSKSRMLYGDSAPCVPVNVTYTTVCPSTMALVAWPASKGSTDYYVMATESGGVKSHCNSSNTSCVLPGLDCGLSYDLQVVAVGNKCRSNASLSVLLKTEYHTLFMYFATNSRRFGLRLTAPCLPKNVDVLMSCRNNSATLSWEQSRGAQQYLGVVESDKEVVYSCNTRETNCFIPALSCGAIYSFSVLATDQQCNSSFTEPIVSGMVPCPPDEVKTFIYRESVKPQEVEIFWNKSHCGADYMATVQGQIGYDPESSFTLNSYWTSYMDFYIPVPCSSSYSVTVTARNTAGLSYGGTSLPGHTAPCPPQVNPVELKDGGILISWKESAYADGYIVIDMDRGSTICSTPGLSCVASSASSIFQVIAVNPSGRSDPASVPGTEQSSYKWIFIKKFIGLNLWPHLIVWRRYIDDVLCVWNGPQASLDSFFTEVNENDFNLEFTMESSTVSVNFLDLTLKIVGSQLLSCTYFKPTDRNGYVPRTSCHHPRWLETIPKSQFIRLRRNCTSIEDFDAQSSLLSQRFSEKGYDMDRVALPPPIPIDRVALPPPIPIDRVALPPPIPIDRVADQEEIQSKWTNQYSPLPHFTPYITSDSLLFSGFANPIDCCSKGCNHWIAKCRT